MKELIYHRLLLPSVERNASRPMATHAGTGTTTTYAEHLDRVTRLIGGLRGLGVGAGDRFAGGWLATRLHGADLADAAKAGIAAAGSA